MYALFASKFSISHHLQHLKKLVIALQSLKDLKFCLQNHLTPSTIKLKRVECVIQGNTIDI